MNRSILSTPLASMASRALVLALLFAAFSAPAAWAQEAPAYIGQYKEAMQMAKQAKQLEGTDVNRAAAQYAEAYKQLINVSQMASEEGALKNADKAKTTAGKLAYMAGMLLHNDGNSAAAQEHFQWGVENVPGYARNRQALQTAEGSQKQGIIVEASQQLRNGNARQALATLEEADDSATKFFYMAEAYQALNELDQSMAYANRALEAGGLSADRQGRMYLLIGETHMKQGNKEAAITQLKRAQSTGSAQIRSRAEGLLEQLGAA